jgi:putative endonuclease
MWYVYLLRCSDKSIYCGITNNLEKRIYAHNNLPSGSTYTKSRRPVKLVYCKEYDNRSLASKEEYRIKQLTRNEKLAIIEEYATI